MRFIYYVLLVSFAVIAGCRSQASGVKDPASGVNDSASGVKDPAAQSAGSDGFGPRGGAVSDSLAQKAMNSYTGHLGDGLITVIINYISGGAVSGYVIQRGRRRNFNGDVHLQGAALYFEMEEAGDRPGKFSFQLDTASWKMSGQVSKGEESRPLKAARLPDGWRNRDYNTWFPADRIDSRDSMLILKNDGLCEFRFYLRPWDSTSQLIRIRGNYERQSGGEEGYKVEWEENEYLKPASETLMVKCGVLTGNGLRLEHLAVP